MPNLIKINLIKFYELKYIESHEYNIRTDIVIFIDNLNLINTYV